MALPNRGRLFVMNALTYWCSLLRFGFSMMICPASTAPSCELAYIALFATVTTDNFNFPPLFLNCAIVDGATTVCNIALIRILAAAYFYWASFNSLSIILKYVESSSMLSYNMHTTLPYVCLKLSMHYPIISILLIHCKPSIVSIPFCMFWGPSICYSGWAMIRMSSLLPIFSSNPFNDDEIFVWSANIVDSNMNVPCAKLLDILFNSSISLSSRMIAVAPNYAYIYAMLRPTGVRAPVIIMCFPINCDGIHLRLLTVSLSILYMYSAICY